MGLTTECAYDAQPSQAKCTCLIATDFAMQISRTKTLGNKNWRLRNDDAGHEYASLPLHACRALRTGCSNCQSCARTPCARPPPARDKAGGHTPNPPVAEAHQTELQVPTIAAVWGRTPCLRSGLILAGKPTHIWCTERSRLLRFSNEEQMADTSHQICSTLRRCRGGRGERRPHLPEP